MMKETVERCAGRPPNLGFYFCARKLVLWGAPPHSGHLCVSVQTLRRIV